VHSVDDGASWEWWCEEALGAGTLYAVVATGPGEVVLGSNTGLWRSTPGAAPAMYSGLPTDAQVGALGLFDGKVLADVVSVEDVDGLYLCTGTSCAATSLVEDGRYVQSIRVDGGVAWVVTRWASTLHSVLYRSTDGETWTEVYDWADASESRTLLDADGDTLWAWALPRDTETAPWLERSDDGGVSWATAWTATNPTQELPGVARVGGTLLLSDNLGRTWRTDDAGASWTDVGDSMPMIRCTHYVDGETRICADHFADGFDFARLDAPDAWSAFGCMDRVAVADEACAAYEDAYLEAGLYGGGDCDATWSAPEEEAEAPCGCGGGAADTAGLLVLGGWRLGRRRRRAR
jgi:hypothetical protein